MSQTVTVTETAEEDGLDPTQVRLLEEQCILVNEADEAVGAASKKACHRVGPGGLPPPLHRAFSVFCFSPSEAGPSQGRMLLQRRAPAKITFPGQWTNACCSHPLNNPDEMGGVEGARRAARRKLGHELGVPASQVPLDQLVYMTRILYCASSDATWGEHEVDYIFFLRREITLDINPNEVCQVKWVTKQELADMMSDTKNEFTPWFRLIWQSGKLSSWWDSLENLVAHQDHATIHRLS